MTITKQGDVCWQLVTSNGNIYISQILISSRNCVFMCILSEFCHYTISDSHVIFRILSEIHSLIHLIRECKANI